MKWTYIIIGLFIFGYFLTPVLWRAMKKNDYDNLYNGMQNAKIAGGSFHENRKGFHPYEDRLIYKR